MLIMMKRDWAYDLVPGSTRRTLPAGKSFDVAPEIGEAAIADGAAELLGGAVQPAAAPAPATEPEAATDAAPARILKGKTPAPTEPTATPAPEPAPAETVEPE